MAIRVAYTPLLTHHRIQDGKKDRGRTQIRCHLREQTADDNDEKHHNQSRNAREELQRLTDGL